MKIRLIATDLDGTLLNNKKQISMEDQEAIFHAVARGVEFVPATGRHYEGVPAFLRELPFLRYVIVNNGAQIYECQSGHLLYSAEISPNDTEALLDYLDTLSVFYESFHDGEIWTPIEHYKADAATNRVVNSIQHFRERLRIRNRPISKLQILFRDTLLRNTTLQELNQRFPDLITTSARKDSLEVNHKNATKGKALDFLCHYLNISMNTVIALGDGTNDISMLTLAGLGVAMENGFDEVKQSADYITSSNEKNGFGAAVKQLVLS